MAQQSWSGLKALWTAVKRVLTVLAMGIVGAVVLGTAMAILTLFAYAFGYLFGIPLGFVYGAALVGPRIAPRDAAIVFVGSAGVWFTMNQLLQAMGHRPDVGLILGLLACAVTAPILLAIVPRKVSPEIRYSAAVVLTIGFVLSTLIGFAMRVYGVG